MAGLFSSIADTTRWFKHFDVRAVFALALCSYMEVAFGHPRLQLSKDNTLFHLSYTHRYLLWLPKGKNRVTLGTHVVSPLYSPFPMQVHIYTYSICLSFIWDITVKSK